jgi:Protein of unknown function (DUF2829)
MQQFEYCIKARTVKAVPMDRAEYNHFRGWDLPVDENPNDLGYMVEYEPSDDILPNHEQHLGYISWFPSPIFNMMFHANSHGFGFAYALEQVKEGKRVQRKGWNGKKMFIFLVNGSTFTVNREPLLSILGAGTEVNYHGHIDMKTADGMIVPWLCSQTDMLADDWQIV